jgi:hypothetical protein
MKTKRMGVMEKDFRASLIKYKQDGNLLALLRATVAQADAHVHYYWQYKYLLYQLERVYAEIITNANENPSHREGKVDAISPR